MMIIKGAQLGSVHLICISGGVACSALQSVETLL